ncbi:MAG: phospholipase [Hahellaceae bacterium]|nr:phospholipase [Hahellaceae bacterium]
MKTKLIALSLTAGTLFASTQAHAWSQETHKKIVLDAVRYMEANPATTQYSKLKQVANTAGISMAKLADILGQGAYDVDDFEDTYICGAVSGDCQLAPVWGAGASIVKYTSYWHFQNHTQGPDAHGNDFGGYNYDKLTVWGDIDNMAATWLYGDHLDDGKGGMKGWFWSDNSKYNSYDITEKNYRLGGYSTKSMYADFEKMPFQPIDNLGQYWYSQFLARPTAQTLGFVLHTTDLLQPHHTWTTSDLNHSGWESWVRDYYDSESLNDLNLVAEAMNDFTPLPADVTDIRPLLTEGGSYSYAIGGMVLSSQDHNDRVQVAKETIPHAIAMVVHILNHAANRF